jgi:hypothetical protein
MMELTAKERRRLRREAIDNARFFLRLARQRFADGHVQEGFERILMAYAYRVADGREIT